MLVVPAAPAWAGPEVDQAAFALRTDPVYVDADAELRLTAAQERGLEARIATAQAGPLFVAVMPEAAKAEAPATIPTGVSDLLLSALRERGTYAVVAGRRIRAGSADLRAGELAAAAAREHSREGLPAVLNGFVDGVAPERAGRRWQRRRRRRRWRRVRWAGAARAAGRGRRPLRRQPRPAPAAGERRDGRARRRPAARGPRRPRRARRRRARDRRRHRDARRRPAGPGRAGARAGALRRGRDRARPGAPARGLRSDQLARSRRARWSMEVAKAHLEGRPPPERRPPCFFDPRHGPSVARRGVGAARRRARPLPVCAADAVRIESGEDPHAREVDGRRAAHALLRRAGLLRTVGGRLLRRLRAGLRRLPPGPALRFDAGWRHVRRRLGWGGGRRRAAGTSAAAAGTSAAGAATLAAAVATSAGAATSDRPAAEVLGSLPEGSVDAIVTSPKAAARGPIWAGDGTVERAS